MLYYWLLFFFLAFGAKVVLAFAMIYLLLPSDRTCSQCDEETVRIRTNRLGRIGLALSFGHVQLRWCPRCGWEGLTRAVRDSAPSSNAPARKPSATPF